MNSFELINPALFDVPVTKEEAPNGPGYPAEQQAGDTRDALWDACGGAEGASRKMPRSWMVEQRDWEEKARENDRLHTWPRNYVDRFTNQQPTDECTCHSLRTNFEGARNRSRGINFPDGPKRNFRYEQSKTSGSVWVSPLSIYSEANPGKRGGANVRQVLEIACRRGFLPEKIQPAEYGFKHDLVGTTGTGGLNQSHGSWVRVSQFPDGWEETAAWFKPLEVVFPESFEEAVSLVLNGAFVSVGRSGHAIPWSQYLPGQGMAYIDSYDVVRYDSMSVVRSAWRGSFAIISTTQPDDWSKPAG